MKFLAGCGFAAQKDECSSRTVNDTDPMREKNPNGGPMMVVIVYVVVVVVLNTTAGWPSLALRGSNNRETAAAAAESQGWRGQSVNGFWPKREKRHGRKKEERKITRDPFRNGAAFLASSTLLDCQGMRKLAGPKHVTAAAATAIERYVATRESRKRNLCCLMQRITVPSRKSWTKGLRAPARPYLALSAVQHTENNAATTASNETNRKWKLPVIIIIITAAMMTESRTKL